MIYKGREVRILKLYVAFAVPNTLPGTLGVGCHTFYAVLCVSSPEHGVVTLSANVMDEPVSPN